jgi:hypothetical protein
MPHLHGLSFSADGTQLIVPAHSGLRIYEDGVWHTPAVPAHDYMGYAGTDSGFYSSGHPAPGSDLVNPLGLVKSSDGGKTLTTLAFAGESDFHLMAVGYRSHAIYLINPQPNSQLAAGLFLSRDDGKTWQQATVQGVTGQPIQIAVHPTDPAVVALATEAGLLLSTDSGDSFALVAEAEPVSAAMFSPDGARLLFGTTSLAAYDLASKQITTLTTPEFGTQDAIAYLAVNPMQPNVLALASFERHIYLSIDGGQSWQQIARAGASVSDSGS